MEQNTFSQLQQWWQQQDKRLARMEHVQQATVHQLLGQRIGSTHRRFLVECAAMVVLGLAVEVGLLTQAGRFFGQWSLAVPYLVFNAVYLLMTVDSALWVVRFRRHDPARTPTVAMMQFADRWMLTLRRTLGWGLLVLVPVAILSGLPVAAHLFGHTFSYAALRHLEPWRMAAAALVYLAAVAYTLHEMRLTRDLRSNLHLYHQLLHPSAAE